MPFSLNSEPVKYALLALTAPLWLPFIKALWKEFNDSLRDEGGVLGIAPSKKDLAKLNRDLGHHESPLVSETWEDHLAGRTRRRPGSPARGKAAPQRPRGFR